MLVIASVMLVVLVLSALVLGAVAYPLRGRVPSQRWVARMLTPVADLVAVIDPELARRGRGGPARSDDGLHLPGPRTGTSETATSVGRHRSPDGRSDQVSTIPRS